MDVRRIRPLVPPPYPRRNRYTPVIKANCTHSVSVRKLSFALMKPSYRSVAPPLLSTNSVLVYEASERTF